MTDLTRLRMEQEKLKLNQKYASHSDPFHTEPEESASYWSFLKLRTIFSIILLLFVLSLSKTAGSRDAQKIRSVIQHIDQRDPYTQKALNEIQKFPLTLKQPLPLIRWKRLFADYFFFGFGSGSSSNEARRKR